MIVYRTWDRSYRQGLYYHSIAWEGWFLLGVLPLFIRQTQHTKTLS